MKQLFKRKKPEPTGRHRLRGTDTTASNSYSYYGRRSEAVATTGRQSPRDNPVAARTAERVRKFWLQRFGLVTLLAVLVVAAVNSLVLSSNPKVVLLNTGSTVLHSPAEYQAAASDILKGSVPNHSKLTINTHNVSQALQKKFPELTVADVTLPLVAHRPVIYLAGARPALVLAASSGSYVVSSAGKVLLPSAQLASSVRDKLPLVTDQSGLELRTGAQVLTTANVRFIETVAGQLAARSYPVKTMTIPRAAGELDVQISGQPYYIKFNLQSDSSRQQAGTFFATMVQLQKGSIVPAHYVDVRVDGRAYYQ